MAEVTLIKPKPCIPKSGISPLRKERVAAYVRVSTDHEEQQSSLEAQTNFYKKKIIENKNWEFAGIYSDNGLSGTSYRRRKAFLRMIEDCRQGKISMILTKSISRFARNTVDTINTVRELKELGIGVMFEKENIWSLDSNGEFLLAVLSSIAQEESRNISENVSWGQRKKMADGRFSMAYSRFMGYDKGKDGNLVINKGEAEVVKKVFALYIQGYSTYSTAAELTRLGIKTIHGLDTWHASTVREMLLNEKYKGDALLQKSFIPDFMTKKRRLNKGELPQFYVSNNHDAIIAPKLWDHVQQMMDQKSRSESIYSGITPFSGKLICGVCGNFYGTKTWHNVDKVWTCRERSKTGHVCSNMHLYDDALRYYVKKMMLRLVKRNVRDVEYLKSLITGHVSDPDRTERILRYIRWLYQRDPDKVEEGDEPCYVLKSAVMFPDMIMEIRIIDGQVFRQKIKRYSPKKGWVKSDDNVSNRKTKRMPYEFVCLSCGEHFMAINKNRKYCSNACYIAGRFWQKDKNVD